MSGYVRSATRRAPPPQAARASGPTPKRMRPITVERPRPLSPDARRPRNLDAPSLSHMPSYRCRKNPNKIRPLAPNAVSPSPPRPTPNSRISDVITIDDDDDDEDDAANSNSLPSVHEAPSMRLRSQSAYYYRCHDSSPSYSSFSPNSPNGTRKKATPRRRSTLFAIPETPAAIHETPAAIHETPAAIFETPVTPRPYRRSHTAAPGRRSTPVSATQIIEGMNMKAQPKKPTFPNRLLYDNYEGALTDNNRVILKACVDEKEYDFKLGNKYFFRCSVCPARGRLVQNKFFSEDHVQHH